MSQNNNDINQFRSKVNQLIKDAKPIKITFAKQRPQNKTILNVHLKTATIKNQLQYSLTYRYKTKDEVHNFRADQVLTEMNQLLSQFFFTAVLFTDTEELTLLQNKKDNTRLIIKKLAKTIILETTHDEVKNRIIPEDRTYLRLLGLAGVDGKIYDKSQDKYRQINKYVEIIDHLIKDWPMDKTISIADMGSGKGYLTFALYDHITSLRGMMRCKMTGYELRPDLVSLCYNIAIQSQYVGLVFQQKSIEDVQLTDTNMVIALHACDIATDMAIAKGIKAQAQYIVVSPCCHKQIRKEMTHHNELTPILKHGIMEERMAEMITDGIRALLMEAHGYKTQIFEFISNEHTSKNLMITGIKSSPNPNALAEIAKIKEHFGIKTHYLETLLSK